MAIKYRKNDRGEFVKPKTESIFWWLVWLLIAMIVNRVFVWLFDSISFYKKLNVMLIFLFLALVLVGMVQFFLRLKRGHLLKNLFRELEAEQEIKLSLVATMNLNQHKQAAFIEVPNVEVFLNTETVRIIIERLAGMNDLDSLVHDIDVSFKSRALRSFATVSANFSIDGTSISFLLEDLGKDHTFRPELEEELVLEPYHLKLLDNFEYNLADFPGVGIYGQSGSGKSTTLLLIVLELLNQGADLRFIDGKEEFSAIDVFYPSDKIATSTDSVLELLRGIVAELEKRKKILSEQTKRLRKWGLRGYDVQMKPIVIIGDEISGVVGLMDKKEKAEFDKLISICLKEGRSNSIFTILGNQFADVDSYLKNSSRSQLTTRILLGNANSELKRMVFNESKIIDRGDVERFSGYYISEKNRSNQPQWFRVPDLHSHGLNDLEVFERAYKRGLEFGEEYYQKF